MKTLTAYDKKALAAIVAVVTLMLVLGIVGGLAARKQHFTHPTTPATAAHLTIAPSLAAGGTGSTGGPGLSPATAPQAVGAFTTDQVAAASLTATRLAGALEAPALVGNLTRDSGTDRLYLARQYLVPAEYDRLLALPADQLDGLVFDPGTDHPATEKTVTYTLDPKPTVGAGLADESGQLVIYVNTTATLVTTETQAEHTAGYPVARHYEFTMAETADGWRVDHAGLGQ